MGVLEDEDDDDFLSLFDDFNEEDGLIADNISANLRADVGLGAGGVVHEGEADVGRSTWVAPSMPGLQNSRAVNDKAGWYMEEEDEGARKAAEERRAAADDNMWNELTDEGAEYTSNVSSNLFDELKDEHLKAARAVRAMDDSEAKQAASVFNKLAAHGRGTSKLSLDEFSSLLSTLAEDENGQALLQLLVAKRKVRATSSRAAIGQ